MIPLSTDAPVYHWPYASLLLMILMTLLTIVVPPESYFKAQGRAGPEGEPAQAQPAPAQKWDEADFAAPEPMAPGPEGVNGLTADQEISNRSLPSIPWRSIFNPRLVYGTLHPWQWFVSPLVQQGYLQLVINLICLWAFGMVVEGKVGWLRFLVLFFCIAVTHAALLQFLMLFSSGSTSGADAAILGLLGVAVAWAPKNSFEVLFLPPFGTFEISILMFSLLELIFSSLLLNALSVWEFCALPLGVGIGLLFVQRQWVDCEGWDLISVLQNRHTETTQQDQQEELDQEVRQLVRASRERIKDPAEQADAGVFTEPKLSRRSQKVSSTNTEASRSGSQRRRQASAGDDKDQQQTKAEGVSREQLALEDIESLIREGNVTTAIKMRTRLQQSGMNIALPQTLLAMLIRHLLAEKDFFNAIPFMEEHIARFDTSRSGLQLNLAKVLLHLERPNKAKAVLRNVDKSSLDEGGQRQWNALAGHVKRQIDEGVIELSD